MNIDRGKTSFTSDDIEELRLRASRFKSENGHSWTDLEKLSGIPAGTWSPFVTGRYTGDNSAVAERVHKFFLHHETQEEIARDAPTVPGFQATRTSKRIMNALSWAQRGKFVVIVGDPGSGKTAAIDQYCAVTPQAWKATMSPATKSLNPMLLAVARAMSFQRLVGSNIGLSRMIRDRVTGRATALVIDEAQWLDEAALEELRAIHDETKMGLALVGNREVLTRVEGGSRQAAFAQLYSRISVRLVIEKPFPEDVSILMAAWGVESPPEQEFLRQIALKPGGGGVRSLTHTLEYATIMASDEPRTLSHLKQAWVALSTRAAS